jgi:hypothetical protein
MSLLLQELSSFSWNRPQLGHSAASEMWSYGAFRLLRSLLDCNKIYTLYLLPFSFGFGFVYDDNKNFRYYIIIVLENCWKLFCFLCAETRMLQFETL